MLQPLAYTAIQENCARDEQALSQPVPLLSPKLSQAPFLGTVKQPGPNPFIFPYLWGQESDFLPLAVQLFNSLVPVGQAQMGVWAQVWKTVFVQGTERGRQTST